MFVHFTSKGTACCLTGCAEELGAQGERMPTGGDQPWRSPAHAGRLRPWERFTIGLVLVLIAAIVVALSISDVHTHSTGSRVRQKTTPAVERFALGSGPGSAVLTGPGSIPFPSAPQENERLTAALAPVRRRGTGAFAAGVIDAATGAVAVYHGGRLFHTASIVKTDILATLLLQHQKAGRPLSQRQRVLAAEMIEHSDDAAASDLWDVIGRAGGLRAANQQLGLRHTTPGAGVYWGLTSTTVDDQLRLLADLTSRNSPLSAQSRSFELGLMRHVAPGQAWGVTAAATPGTRSAVKNGWLPDGSYTAWVINSIGVIYDHGHEFLVVVLSKDQPSESAGIGQAEATARAVVSAVIHSHPATAPRGRRAYRAASVGGPRARVPFSSPG
jgi:Beta-lactamase enzyme family